MEYVAIRIIKFDSRNGYSLVFYWSLSFYMCGQTAYGLFTFIVILRKNYRILAFNILDWIYDIKLCTNSHVKYYLSLINSSRWTYFNIKSIISPSRFKLKFKQYFQALNCLLHNIKGVDHILNTNVHRIWIVVTHVPWRIYPHVNEFISNIMLKLRLSNGKNNFTNFHGHFHLIA